MDFSADPRPQGVYNSCPGLPLSLSLQPMPPGGPLPGTAPGPQATCLTCQLFQLNAGQGRELAALPLHALCWHHGTPTSGPPQALSPTIHTGTQRRALHPQKSLDIQFNEKLLTPYAHQAS